MKCVLKELVESESPKFEEIKISKKLVESVSPKINK